MSLRLLSDDDILSRINELVRRERGMTLRVLDHLVEIERRKLHLELGHSSMFDYCTRGLGYSESAAWRRIQSARCVARFPEVRALLESNDVNLTTFAHVARVLTWENREDLLASVRGRSLAEVKEILARMEPRAIPRDIVQPVAVRKAPPVSTLGAVLRLEAPEDRAPEDKTPVAAAPAAACEKSDYCRSGSNTTPAERPVSSPPSVSPVDLELRTRLSFTASGEFMESLDRVKAIAWHRLGSSPSLERVFALTMDLFLEKNDPIRRRERRDARARRVGV